MHYNKTIKVVASKKRALKFAKSAADEYGVTAKPDIPGPKSFYNAGCPLSAAGRSGLSRPVRRGLQGEIRHAGFDVDEVREVFYETGKEIPASKPGTWPSRRPGRRPSFTLQTEEHVMGKEDWKDKHYAYFCNRECEYFPCHPTEDPNNFNCLFCYCPLYVLGERCGGNFVYLPNGHKDCSRCMFPHLRENYGAVTERYGEILAAIPNPPPEKGA